ncbi:hypothetical protein ACHAWO_008444 [Cyclotella atomus]|uniref:DUF6824 domain-containing protein n=1 Tax=Cyclotella atomus TaxID=382360 RepID=A0ABD3QSM2_9STRA
MKSKKEDEHPMPPSKEPVSDVTCKDVVMGRGSGTQNHCGNVTYRKLVYLNKELYATSSKFDKLKISKAIVAAIRNFGGRFLQAEGESGNFDIGDKRAWDKTSQALREGQTEIRAKLAAEEVKASGAEKVAEYKQVISEQTFLAYACKILQSLYDPATGSMTSCGPNCPHARRRATMNRTDIMAIQHAMQMQHQQGNVPINWQQDPNPNMPIPPVQYYDNANFGNSYEHISSQAVMGRPAANHQHTEFLSSPNQMGVFSERTEVPTLAPNNDVNSMEPLPYNMPYLDQPQCADFAQPNNAGEESWDPYLDGRGNRDTISSFDTAMNSYDTDALRKLLSDDVVDMESDEMSKQLTNMIRRKSQGLVRIDAIEAFEDLVFEEDSTSRVKFDFPEPRVSNASDKSWSGLTTRGESLMNMSLMTIEDKDEASTLKAADDLSEASGKRLSRVSFKPENVSAMSLDIGSIRDLDINDSSESPKRDSIDLKTSMESPDSPALCGSSRSMGFPIRKTVMRSFNAGIPTVIPSKEDETTTRRNVSTLTLSEASILQQDIEFSEMTKNIAPPSSELSLKGNMSFSNISMMSAVDESVLGEDKKGVNLV